MKLLERYALQCGLKIGKQFLHESFFPLETDRYITWQASSGMAAKNYPYYNEVIRLIRDQLAAANIRIVQLGGKDDQPLLGAIHLQGKTTIHQSNYLLARALLHIGNDSWCMHRGGELGVPLLGLYGSTTVANHSPFSYDPARSIFIESHRFGRNPSFQAQEHPSTIAVIPPEKVASGALKLLGIEDTLTRRSLYIGPDYNTVSFEIVPNMVPNPSLNLGVPVVRMDFEFNEQVLAQNLQIRKCAIATDREINLNLLAQLKGQIAMLRIEVDKLDPNWIKQVKRVGVPLQAICDETDPAKIAAMRLALYDTILFDTIEEPTVDDLRKEIAVYTNSTLDSTLDVAKLRFRSNRFLLSSGKIHLSTAHWRAGTTIDSVEQNEGVVIDDPSFWAEQKSFYLYTQ